MINDVKHIVLDIIKKQYLIVSKTLPLQINKFDEVAEWNCVVDEKGAVLDIQVDEYEENIWSCQIVSLIEEDEELRQSDDYKNVKVIVVDDLLIYIANNFANYINKI